MSGNHPGLSNNFIRSGEKFEWSKENLKEIKKIISKYPKERKQSAVMPLLYLAQEQNKNWVSITYRAVEAPKTISRLPKIEGTSAN